MAKATLPTNFKDDILASSMGSKRRYNVINNSDGTISLEDVTDYTQVGSTFGAAQINATNAAANAAADASKIIDDYDTLMANTQAGYMAGALAVKELNSNLITDISQKSLVLATNGNSGSIIEILVKNYKTLTVTISSRSVVSLAVRNGNNVIKTISTTGTYTIDVSSYEYINFYAGNSSGTGYVIGNYSLSKN